jgi:hypothetical protein
MHSEIIKDLSLEELEKEAAHLRRDIAVVTEYIGSSEEVIQKAIAKDAELRTVDSAAELLRYAKTNDTQLWARKEFVQFLLETETELALRALISTPTPEEAHGERWL